MTCESRQVRRCREREASAATAKESMRECRQTRKDAKDQKPAAFGLDDYVRVASEERCLHVSAARKAAYDRLLPGWRQDRMDDARQGPFLGHESQHHFDEPL